MWLWVLLNFTINDTQHMFHNIPYSYSSTYYDILKTRTPESIVSWQFGLLVVVVLCLMVALVIS